MVGGVQVGARHNYELDGLMLTFGSLFSGIGGIDLGLQRAGWSCRWQVENDPFRCSILERHWPDVERHGDIREVDFAKLAPVDLIAGGFPCQPVSGAGKRQAQSDERWLWPEFARAIRELRPGFALIENVAGLLDRGFGDVLSDLARSGYDAEWQLLPAAIVGAPHIRSRLWTVAYAAEGRFRQQAHIEAGAPFVFSRRVLDTVRAEAGGSQHWRAESGLVRMVDGLSNGMGNEIAALGDAVVPQAAEFMGRVVAGAVRLTTVSSGRAALPAANDMA